MVRTSAKSLQTQCFQGPAHTTRSPPSACSAGNKLYLDDEHEDCDESDKEDASGGERTDEEDSVKEDDDDEEAEEARR